MFIHLHVHSTYSDGLATPYQLVERAYALGFSALALTDHNTLDGHAAFIEAAQEFGLHPILGVEVPLTIGDRRGHTVLLAHTPEEAAHLRWLVARKKKILLGDLHRVGTVTSGCLGGIAAQYLQEGSYWDAMDILQRCYGELGEKFAIEVQPTFGAILPWMLSIAKNIGVPTIATNDVHYLLPTDAVRHRQVGLYLSTEEQMKASSPFPDYREAVSNVYRYALTHGIVSRITKAA